MYNLWMTFGVEIELQKYEEYEDKKATEWALKDRPHARKMKAALKAAGLEAEIDAAGYESWCISKDGSINDSDQQDNPVLGVEIKTPVLYAGRADDLRQVRIGCDVINSTWRVTTDSSTGLHVHCGDGTRGLPLRTLQNIALIAVGFEHLLNSLHPDERLVSDDGYPNWTYPLSATDALRGLQPGAARMLKVLAAQTYEGLYGIVNTYPNGGARWKGFSINFLEMVRVNGKRTVEFRQHAGTTDPVEILHWVKFVTALVEYCHHATDVDLSALVAQVSNPRFTVLSLMGAIGGRGLAATAAHYEPRLYPARLWTGGHSMPAEDLHNLSRVVNRLRLREDRMQAVERQLVSQGLKKTSEIHWVVDDRSQGRSGTFYLPWREQPYTWPPFPARRT